MFLLNLTRKIIYIIFVIIILSIILINYSRASNHILSVEELEITEDIDLKFSRNKVIDNAFNKALDYIDNKYVIQRDEHLSTYDG